MLLWRNNTKDNHLLTLMLITLPHSSYWFILWFVWAFYFFKLLP